MTEDQSTIITPWDGELLEKLPTSDPGSTSESDGVEREATELRSLSLGELLSMRIKPREYLLEPIIPEKGLVMLYGPRGTGKTFVGLAIAYAVATGADYLRWVAPARKNVLYIDGEMPLAVLQERLAQIVEGSPDEAGPVALSILAADYVEGGIPNLAMPEAQGQIESLLEGVDLIVIDNISTLASSGRDNDAESWGPMQEWLLSLRRLGKSVLLVHHAGKSGGQRGTSRREDVLDTVISLRRPSDYSPEQGARFEIHLDKARGIYGDEAKPFEARLEIRDGSATWTTRDLEDSQLEQVAALLRDKQSVREIAEITGMSKSQVHRLKKRSDAEAPREDEETQ